MFALFALAAAAAADTEYGPPLVALMPFLWADLGMLATDYTKVGDNR